jgi:hypothetical protein
VEQDPEALADFSAPLLIQFKDFFNQPSFIEFAFSIILGVRT